MTVDDDDLAALVRQQLKTPTGYHFGPDGEPISFLRWVELMGSPAARVGNAHIGRVRIATDWIGTDVRAGRHASPRIYETMTFARRQRDHNAPWNLMQWRYSSRAEALAGHIALVNRVRSRGVQALVEYQRRQYLGIMLEIIEELGRKVQGR